MIDRNPDGFRIENVREPARPELVRQAVGLWLDEKVLDPTEAQRRAAEILLVCTRADSGEVAGIATTYLDTAAALGVPMWHFRTFVAGRWRRNDIAFHLLHAAIDHHAGRFAAGTDTRALGLYVEIENDPLRRTRNEAVWPTTGMVFVGFGDRGQHCRARFFDGARVR